MCGISGAIGFISEASQYLENFNDSQVHRGPDRAGTFVKDSVFLGHRRLSIIDLNSGAQPMHTIDQKHTIVYNGELYNYKELKEELVQKGIKFNTASDTEVILYAYKVWGKDCLNKFRGMFSFAIADFENKIVFMARDQFGIKPLLYHSGANGFYFASELSAFRKLPFLKFSINEEALDQYFWHQYIPAPNTIFKDFHKLPPAHFLITDLTGNIKEKKKYWDFRFESDSSKSYEDWIEEANIVLKESVKSHLVSDVPFGAFLSGGIDSSLVVSYMSEILDKPVKTFSIGFDDQNFSELEYARVIANKYQTDHHEQILEPNALSVLPDLVTHYGEPFGDSSSLPTYYVSQLAGNHVKMVLSGDGGDEGFAGYGSYLKWIRDQSHPGISPLKRAFYPIGRTIFPHKYIKRNSSQYWVEIMRYLPFELRKKLYNSSSGLSPNYKTSLFKKLFDEAKDFDHVQKAQYMDLGSYLPFDILKKVDIASMAHSLEVRTPLIDIKVWELVSKIPSNMHFSQPPSGLDGKMILKDLLASKIDKQFAFREKKGFSIPLAKWFGSGESLVKERLKDSSNLKEFLEPTTIDSILKEGFGHRIWLLLFLDEWLHQFKD